MEKQFFGVASTLIAIFGYALYARSVLRDRTRPHAISWFLWGVISVITFAVQFTEGAGAGSWATAVGGAGCLFVFVLALSKGTRRFNRFDWACLALALVGIGLWLITDIPLTAAIMVTLADAIAYIPTYVKGFRLPFEEHLAPYIIGAIIPLLAIPAIERYVVANWLSPASLIVTNAAFVTMILLRRRLVVVSRS